ncbi:MAG: GreA/GreB family elongation factor [Polyangiales bacterium]|nr:GreA/GreB family elongation factor [Myxococcales bacterium]
MPRRSPDAPLDKRALVTHILEALSRELDTQRAAAEASQLAATHEESRPENDKDTRALEASYLARGQAMRVEETAEAIGRMKFFELRSFGPDDEIGLSALVTLEDDDGEMRCFLAPAAGGTEIEFGGNRIRVVTPASPLGRALLEKCVGDEAVVTVRGVKRTYEVVRVD